MKIGFFDSGLGGLTILKAVAAALPDYDYEFYGDTANLPYGDKSEAEIFALTKAGVLHLLQRDCALIIIACNTASAETLRQLQDTILTDEYESRRLLGVIIPTIEEVLASDLSSVALIGTKRTIDSGKYDLEFAKADSQVQLITMATPELVPLIEVGNLEAANVSVHISVEQFRAAGAEGLILGCTHYTLLKENLRKAFDSEFRIFSQDEIIPAKLMDYLARHGEMETTLTRGGKRTIYLTNTDACYDRAIASLLGGIPLLD